MVGQRGPVEQLCLGIVGGYLAFEEKAVYLLPGRSDALHTGESQAVVVERVVAIATPYAQVELLEGVAIVGYDPLFELPHRAGGFIAGQLLVIVDRAAGRAMLPPHAQLVFLALQDAVTGITRHVPVITQAKIEIAPFEILPHRVAKPARRQQHGTGFERSRDRPVAVLDRLPGDGGRLDLGEGVDFRGIAHNGREIFLYGYLPAQGVGSLLSRQHEGDNQYRQKRKPFHTLQVLNCFYSVFPKRANRSSMRVMISSSPAG